MSRLNLTQKIVKKRILEGKIEAGHQVLLKLDQCLLQDATGTLAWLEFEQMGVKKVRPKLVCQYIDHNLIQADNKNMDDHLFLMTIGSKYGARVSLPGNGISHHIHKERFTIPSGTMIGCDSHTCTSGGSGMLAIGVGGMEVAVGMATGTYCFTMPEVVGVKLSGKLKSWCTAKDVILEILKRIGVRGGKGKIFEFFGSGVNTLSVSERSTIANMIVETGATTAVFPSDKRTNEFFSAQKRVQNYKPLAAEKGTDYDSIMDINLDEIIPLISLPHSPGKVKAVADVQGTEVMQAMIGSSTNSSYESIMTASNMVSLLEMNRATSFHVIPGSRQLLQTVSRDGGLIPLLKAGARISEPSCNACIGMGNAPGTKIVSVRSFPRNFEGRSGTDHDLVYLSSPETAVACAITGEITDPRDLGIKYSVIKPPREFVIDDGMVLMPKFNSEVRRGPNIKRLEYNGSLNNSMKGVVLIKAEDDISTDHILPAGASVLPLRSNIPAISKFIFHYYDPGFAERAEKARGGFIVAGKNYGQGSSREHAAIVPMHLGIKAVLAESFARIHRSNLINFGVLPIELSSAECDKIKLGDVLEIKDVHYAVKNSEEIEFVCTGKNGNRKKIKGLLHLNRRERQVLMSGGLLHYVQKAIKNGEGCGC